MAHQTAEGKSPAVRASHKKGNRDSGRERKRRHRSGNPQEHLSPSRIVFSAEGYAVIFGRTKTGWGAHSPDVPGCIAVGRTLQETRKLYREALRMHLEALLEDGDPIPQALTRVEHIAA